jgi:D-glycero-beta-D-manno-heptose-7-phosphate kinase
MHPITQLALSQTRVLVVGDAMLDRYWYGAVERISPEAPVPVVRVTREEERIGAAANVAYNVVSLGAQASLLTVLGTDLPGQRLLELLKASGVSPIIGFDASLTTTVKLRIIGRNQQLLRADFETQPDHETLDAMLADFAAALPAHDAVLFSDYGKGGLAHVARMIALARAAGKPVLVDPKGSDYTRYAGATLLTPNRAEFFEVVGHCANNAEMEVKAQALRQHLQLDALLVTRSEEGMSLFQASGTTHVPTQAREVFDVTGAGDTVIATLATLLAAGVPLADAVVHANRAGGIVVGKFGTAVLSFAELFGGQT